MNLLNDPGIFTHSRTDCIVTKICCSLHINGDRYIGDLFINSIVEEFLPAKINKFFSSYSGVFGSEFLYAMT